jgi:hypothetical protein
MLGSSSWGLGTPKFFVNFLGHANVSWVMQMIVAADSLSQEQARPIEADVIGAAVHVMRIATGEI